MKSRAFSLVAGMMVLLSLKVVPVWAGTEVGQEMMHHQMAMQPGASSMKHEGYGVLKVVDSGRGKVKIAHKAIPELHWSPMTMWFTLRDPLPKGVQVGDNVRFELMKNDANEWVVSHIESVR